MDMPSRELISLFFETLLGLDLRCHVYALAWAAFALVDFIKRPTPHRIA